MSKEYSSIFATSLSGFVASKRAAGYRYDTASYYLHHFDRYCRERHECGSVSRELVLDWAKLRDSENSRTHRMRISAIRQFGRYLQSIGVTDAYVLPSGLSRKVERYVPHFFTHQEIVAFFAACDNLQPHGAMRA